MDLNRDDILKQDKLSTNLNTVDGVLGLLESIVSKMRQGQEVEEHELINGGNQITTARRILRELRESLDLSHIVD